MNFKQLATSIGSFAPTLATMLGGPLAGTAVSALAQALGLKQGQARCNYAGFQAGALTPDQVVAIRAADQKHAEVIGSRGLILPSSMPITKKHLRKSVLPIGPAHGNGRSPPRT